jgi:hypothetical protein
MVWCPDGQLKLRVGKSDAWMDAPLSQAGDPSAWQLLPVGDISICSEPSPLYAPISFEQRLNLHGANVQVVSEIPHGNCQATVSAPAGSGVLMVEYADTLLRSRPRTIQVNGWREARAFAVGDYIGLIENLPDRRIALVCRLTGARATSGWVDNHTPKLEIDFPRGTRFTLFATVAVTDLHGDPVSVAKGRLERAIDKGPDALKQDHRLFWRSFWQKSFVHVTAPFGAGEYLSNLWYFNLYQLASSSRGYYPAHPDGGMWNVSSPNRTGSGAYPTWNTLLPYWSLCAANHLEIANPLIDSYHRMLTCVRRDTQHRYGRAGARYPAVCSRNGTDLTDGKSYHSRHVQSAGLEIASYYAWVWQYTRDLDFLTTKAYPVLRETVTYYLGCARVGADGEAIIAPPGTGDEMGDAEWSIADLSLLKFCLKAAIDASTYLSLDEKLRALWIELAVMLPDYMSDPISGSWLDGVPFEVYPEGRMAALSMVFPSNEVSAAAEEKLKAEATFQASGAHFGDVSWSIAPIIAARLGQATDAGHLLWTQTQRHQLLPQGFMVNGSRANDPDTAEPALDALGVVCLTLQEMLLQVQDGVIRLFPAMPEEWDGAYTLRAPGGYTVMAERKNGVVVWAALSCSEHTRCRLENPWNREVARIQEGKNDILRTDFKYLEFPVEPGLIYTIDNPSHPLWRMPRHRFSGKRASEPKRFGNRLIGLEPNPFLFPSGDQHTKPSSSSTLPGGTTRR